jgi:hypothetical protein
LSNSNSFLTELDSTGSSLIYSTYLGGSPGTTYFNFSLASVALDGSGNVYLAGSAGASDFPVTVGAYQPVNHSLTNNNLFVSKFDLSAAGPQDHQDQTITFDAIGAQLAGTSVALIATASSGLPVAFASATPAICTVNGTTATLLIAGYCNILAKQFGDSTYFPASTGQFVLVNHAHQTIDFPQIPPQPALASVTLVASASSGPQFTSPVTFASTTPSVCTVSGVTATLLIPGYCNVLAIQGGNAGYFPVTAGQWIVVHHANQTIDFPTIAPQVAQGSVTLVATATTTGLPVTFASTTLTVCTVSGNTATLLTPGSCTIKASVAGNAEYFADITGQTFVVQPAN